MTLATIWQSQRRMFAFINDVLAIGPAPPCWDSHRDWFLKRGFIERGPDEDFQFNRIIRGFFVDNVVYVYRSDRFEPVLLHQVQHIVKLLLKDGSIDPDYEVFNGVTPGTVDTHMEPRQRLGKAGDLNGPHPS